MQWLITKQQYIDLINYLENNKIDYFIKRNLNYVTMKETPIICIETSAKTHYEVYNGEFKRESPKSTRFIPYEDLMQSVKKLTKKLIKS